jgi:hypothetical protein
MIRLVLLAAFLVAAESASSDPKTDYLLYCRGCHLANGKSVPPEVPSLHELGELLKSARGREYIIRVPGVSQTPMSDERLAAVLNWVVSEFNSSSLPENFRPYTPSEVGEARVKVLADPKGYRAKLLAD